jgi:hypothetical protein
MIVTVPSLMQFDRTSFILVFMANRFSACLVWDLKGGHAPPLPKFITSFMKFLHLPSLEEVWNVFIGDSFVCSPRTWVLSLFLFYGIKKEEAPKIWCYPRYLSKEHIFLYGPPWRKTFLGTPMLGVFIEIVTDDICIQLCWFTF